MFDKRRHERAHPGRGVLAAFADISVEDFAAQDETFLHGARHPTLGRGYLECVYAPMVDLFRYLEANRLGHRWAARALGTTLLASCPQAVA